MKKFLMAGLVMFVILVFGSVLIAADTSQPGSSKRAYDMNKKKPGSQPGTEGQQNGTEEQQSGKKPYTMQEPKKN